MKCLLIVIEKAPSCRGQTSVGICPVAFVWRKREIASDFIRLHLKNWVTTLSAEGTWFPMSREFLRVVHGH